MLTYAFQVLRQTNYKEIAVEDFENIHDMFAAILGIVMLIGGIECVKAFFKGIVTKDVEPKHANN